MLYETGSVASMTELARRFDVHHTTVSYHIHKHGAEHGSVGSLVDFDTYDSELALLRYKQSQCAHPSTKCSLCGKWHDEIRSEQAQMITCLNERVDYLEKKLTDANIHFEQKTPLDNPLYTVRS